MNRNHILFTRNAHRSPRRAALRASAVFATALAAPVYAADLHLTLGAIDRAEGTLRIAVYASQDTFRKQGLRYLALPAKVGDTQVSFENLPAGDYAVLAFQDLNDNKALELGEQGAPLEPWGGSRLSASLSAPPTWDDARFTLPNDGASINIAMHGPR